MEVRMLDTAAPLPAPPTEAEISRAFRGAPHRFLDVGHSRLAAWRFGRGPDLVFVHGWPLWSATFRRVVARLADRFTCHLVDLPGAGKTESRPGAPIDLVAHAATVRAAIDALGLSSYALVAHDSGGFVARLVAAEDRRARGLVLGNTEIPGHTPWLVAFYALAARVPGGGRLLLRLLRSRAIRRSFLGFGGCFVDPAYGEGEFKELLVDPLLVRGPAADGALALLRQTRKSDMARLGPAHAAIRVPVLLVWGGDDPFFPLPRARAMLDSFAGAAAIEVIPGAKLFAHEDRPEEFVAAARPFLGACFGQT
jgi:pimeloyl-ACP methyl ester carboxylesterase